MNRIPIRNIYYLLLYAWDRLEEADILDIDVDNSTDLIDLFARVLCSGTEHVLRRGIDRHYVTLADDLPAVRGKLLVTESLKRLTFDQGRADCEFDELSADILPNQIVKTTLLQLVHRRELDSEIRGSIWALVRRMRSISAVPLNERAFRQVQLHRNNAFYGFLLQVCRLILFELLPLESAGSVRFRDFLRNEPAMAMLFQHFVRHFYAREQDRYTVGSERLKWAATSESEASLELLPTMITDISLRRHGEKLVIDTKFYREALTEHFGRQRIREEHLYQLFAYLRNSAATPNAPPLIEGMLLYPTVGGHLDLEYRVHGHRVRIATIDLDQDWRLIHQRLLRLVDIRDDASVTASPL